MPDKDMLNQRIARFVVEFYQGQNPDWLIKKYDFIGLLQVTEKGVESCNPEGEKILHKLIHADPRDIVSAKQEQSAHPNKYPWSTNPFSKSTV
jgi:hypothetical protein